MMKKTLFTLLSAATLGLFGPAANAAEVSYPAVNVTHDLSTGSPLTSGDIPLDATSGVFTDPVTTPADTSATRYYTGKITLGPGFQFNSGGNQTAQLNFISTPNNERPVEIGARWQKSSSQYAVRFGTDHDLGIVSGDIVFQLKVSDADDNLAKFEYFIGGAATAATEGTPTYSETVYFPNGNAITAVSFTSNREYGNSPTSSLSGFKSSDAWISGVVAGVVADPFFTPIGGTYSTNQSVEIASNTAGATIHYTTNGTTPTTGSPVYSSPLTVSSSQTIKALAVKSGDTDSAVTEATYVMKAATPVPDVPGGIYNTKDQTVTLTSATPGASIYYTLDGGTPDNTSTLYTAPIIVTDDVTISSIAYNGSYDPSAVRVDTYTFVAGTPEMTPVAGVYTTTQNVTISSSTTTATIRYTTDGSTPDSATGTIYTGPVSVATSQTLKAIAYQSGFADSSVSTAAYVINSSATAYVVPNFSFEAETATAYNTFAGWTNFQSGSFDNVRTVNEAVAGKVGLNFIKLGVDNGVTPVGENINTLTTIDPVTTFAANTVYTLTVSVYRDNDSAGVFGRLSILGDSNAVAATFSREQNTFVGGGFEDVSVVFDTAATPSFVGQDLRVQIATTSTAQYGKTMLFDNVRLTSISGGGPTNNYTSWASAFSSPALSDTSSTADPDSDGLTNAMEYALGLDPRFSSASPGVSSNGGKTITFTKGAEAKANGDVTYQIETSTTLGVAPSPWTVDVANVTNGADTIAITFPNGPANNFARLKVTLAP